MSTLTIEKKTCAICGHDCSNEARFKDDFDQYYHQSCHERSKRAALAIAKPSVPKHRTCTSCNRAVAPGVHRCQDCTDSLATRKRMPTKAKRVVESDEQEEPLSAMFLMSLLIVPALALVPVPLGPILIVATVLLGWLHLVVQAFREHIAWGVLVVLSSFLPILWMAFVVIHWERAKRPFLLLLAATGTFAYQLVKFG